jgi:excinuclease ABC subunit A
VVEHDEETMMAADWLIDLGPGAGEHGGLVVNEGPPAEFILRDSPTAKYLSGRDGISVPSERRKPRRPNPLLAAPALAAVAAETRAEYKVKKSKKKG